MNYNKKEINHSLQATNFRTASDSPPALFLVADRGNTQVFADFSRENINDFRMPRHGGRAFGRGIVVHRMLSSFAHEITPVFFKICEQLRTPHISGLRRNGNAESFFVSVVVFKSRQFAAFLKHQQYSLMQVGLGFFQGSSLGVHAGQLLYPGGDPFAFFLKYCRKFSLHRNQSYQYRAEGQVKHSAAPLSGAASLLTAFSIV